MDRSLSTDRYLKPLDTSPGAGANHTLIAVNGGYCHFFPGDHRLADQYALAGVHME
jgi:hypothetical protein